MPMNNRLMRPRQTGLDPRTISDLELWLDFSDQNSLTLSGSTISEARDKSGKGWKALQDVGNAQPTLVSNAVNGRSAAKFDGNNDVLTIASFPASTAITAFAVLYRTWGTISAYRAACGQTFGGTAGMALFVDAFGTFIDWQAGDILCFGNGFSSGRAPRAIGPRIAATSNAPQVFSAVLSSTETGCFQNGTLISSRINSTGSTTIASGTFCVGAEQPTADFGDYGIATLLLYRRALTTTERQRVQRWLGSTYAITVA